MLRIVWLILAAVFLYDVSVVTGQFAVMRASVASLSSDRRLQAVLVAFCFGALMEGAAGFGAPVAISAAFLVGLGFQPFQAVLLCLIANTAPVAWGGIGIPILTLSKVTGLDVHALSAMSGRILPFMSLLLPFWLVRTMTSWRETRAVWFPLLVIGGTFASVQFIWSNYVGFELVDIVSSAAGMLAGVIVIRLWRPETTWRFPDRSRRSRSFRRRARRRPLSSPDRLGRWQVARAWMPFGLLTITVLIWGIPAIKPLRTSFGQGLARSAVLMEARVAWLHRKVVKGPAVTGHESPLPEDYEKAQVDLAPIVIHGHGRISGCPRQRLLAGSYSTTTMARIFFGTLRRMIPGHCGDYLHALAGICDQVLGNGRRRWGLPSPAPGRSFIRCSARSWAGWESL